MAGPAEAGEEPAEAALKAAAAEEEEERSLEAPAQGRAPEPELSWTGTEHL